ncbi:MAG: DUF5362 family protein [Cytophagaceae bacterium]
MEHTQTIDKDINLSSTGLILTNEAIGFLNTARKWTKFLSILGFIGIGLLVVLAFTIGSILSSFGNAIPIPTMAITAIYLAFALLYFFPVLYLFQFSSSIGDGINENDSEKLAIGFSRLKSHFKFIGIFCIVILSLYALVFLGGLMTALAS